MDDIEQTRLQKTMDFPRRSWLAHKNEGDVNLIVDIGFPARTFARREHVAQGMSTTGFHLVNSVPTVCDASDYGIKTYLDLPMVTGCMGNHSVTR